MSKGYATGKREAQYFARDGMKIPQTGVDTFEPQLTGVEVFQLTGD